MVHSICMLMPSECLSRSIYLSTSEPEPRIQMLTLRSHRTIPTRIEWCKPNDANWNERAVETSIARGAFDYSRCSEVFIPAHVKRACKCTQLYYSTSAFAIIAGRVIRVRFMHEAHFFTFAAQEYKSVEAANDSAGLPGALCRCIRNTSRSSARGTLACFAMLLSCR